MTGNFVYTINCRYMAIDFSSRNLAIAYKIFGGPPESETIKWEYYKYNDKDLLTRFMKLKKDLKEFLQKWQPEICYIEMPALPPTPASVKMVCQASGVIMGELMNFDIKIIEIHNKTWKKIVVGNGNAKKKDIMKYVENKYKLNDISQDVCDSICIYEFGEKLNWKI